MKWISCFRVLALALTATLVCTLFGCNARPTTQPVSGGTSDELITEHASGQELGIVIYDGQAILIPSADSLDYYFGEDLQEGHFYRIVADVDYLYGGIAGYYAYPQIKSVDSIEEVSPDTLSIPTVQERRSGFMMIGDYADGDYLLCEYGRMAVLSDGVWEYRYTDLRSRDDGTLLCYNKDADQEQIEKDISEGIYCTKDFFLIPAQNPGES